jgi:hypothetical protein
MELPLKKKPTDHLNSFIHANLIANSKFITHNKNKKALIARIQAYKVETHILTEL